MRLTPCPAASVDETITVADTATGTINPDFLGFHYEKDIMSGTMFRTSNVNLIKLYNLLGRNGVLRIGGNLADTTSWGGPGEAGSGRSSKLIMSGDVDEFAAFVKTTGWKVIYGVNAKSAPVSSSVDEAKYAVAKLGTSIYGLEYGNEPDHMGIEAYESKWNEFYEAVGPIAPYTGPGTAQGEWVTQFAKDEGKRLALLTRHYYIGSGKKSPSVDEMLASQDPDSASRAKLEKICQTMTAAANAYVPGGKWFFAESNNYSGGGSSGESCKFGSAFMGDRISL